MMKYERPNIELVMTEEDDIITLSNGGIGSGNGQDYKTGNSINVGEPDVINF